MPEASTSTYTDPQQLERTAARASLTITAWLHAVREKDDATRLLAVLLLLKAERQAGSSFIKQWAQLPTEDVVSCACEAATEYVARLQRENWTRQLLAEELAHSSDVWRKATVKARAILKQRHPQLKHLVFLTPSAWEELLSDVRERAEEVASHSGADDGCADGREAMIQCIGRDNYRWLMRRVVETKGSAAAAGSQQHPLQRSLHVLAAGVAAPIDKRGLTDVEDVPPLPQAPPPSRPSMKQTDTIVKDDNNGASNNNNNNNNNINSNSASSNKNTPSDTKKEDDSLPRSPTKLRGEPYATANADTFGSDSDEDESDAAYYAKKKKREDMLQAHYRQLLGITEPSAAKDRTAAGSSGAADAAASSADADEDAIDSIPCEDVRTVYVPFLGMPHAKSEHARKGAATCCAVCELSGVITSDDSNDDQLCKCAGCGDFLHRMCGYNNSFFVTDNSGGVWCSEHCVQRAKTSTI